MSEYNYGRSYKIVFGTPTFESKAYTYQGVVVGKMPPTTIKVDAVTEPGNAVSMSNLESEGDNIRGFNFKLETTRKSGTGSTKAEATTLTLYNLNKESLNILNQEGAVVRVYAGYEGKVDLVYSGDILAITPKTQGNDIAYVCKCRDGALDTKNSKVSISYDEAMSMEEVLKDLANRFPSASLGSVAASKLKEKRVTGGFSCRGRLINIFDKFCQRHSLTYSRFNGKISIRPEQLIQGTPDYLIAKRNTYTLKPRVVKSIEPTFDNTFKSTKQTNTKRGVQLNTFLIPIQMDQFFEVPPETSQNLAGTYKITAIKIALDSRKGPWDVTLTGEPM